MSTRPSLGYRFEPIGRRPSAELTDPYLSPDHGSGHGRRGAQFSELGYWHEGCAIPPRGRLFDRARTNGETPCRLWHSSHDAWHAPGTMEFFGLSPTHPPSTRYPPDDPANVALSCRLCWYGRGLVLLDPEKLLWNVRCSNMTHASYREIVASFGARARLSFRPSGCNRREFAPRQTRSRNARLSAKSLGRNPQWC